MFYNKSLSLIGFMQATLLTSYITLIACFFRFVLPGFEKEVPEFYAPIIMLLLFVMSAVISATLVLGYFGILFWEKKYRQAFTLLAWTLGWLLFYFSVLLIWVFI